MPDFRALWIEEQDDASSYCASITQRNTDELPAGDLLIRVHYSSLNYKDALSAAGNKGVTRNYPHTPGIDAVGLIVASQSDRFSEGEWVIVTGYDLGMNTAGGLADYIRVSADWAVPLPNGLTALQSMQLGTAGLTAGLCVDRLLLAGARPEQGKVLVTGASGGVGSIAVALLSQLGFGVIASSGKSSCKEMLLELGAIDVIDRALLSVASKRPLEKQQWANAIDCVGGVPLANVLKSIAYGGAVTCCGLTASADLPTSVLPFILRGVSLLGVDSVELPVAQKEKIWQRFAASWKIEKLDAVCEQITLEQTLQKLPLFLQGKVAGRIVVAL